MPSDEEVTQRAGRLRAMTGLTEPTFTALLPPFEHALAVYLQDRTIDGHPRTSRRDSTYDHCPLPIIADKRLFMLTYFKPNPIQAVPGQLFRMSQSHANTWIHLLHAVLNYALAHPELLPARAANEFAVLLASERTKVAPTSPLVGMLVPSARPIPRNNRPTTAARRNATRSKTSWWSMSPVPSAS